MVDKVQLVKWESPSGGGTQTDEVPTEINPNEDGIEVRSVFLQDDSSDDKDVEISRNAGGNATFKDKIVTAVHTLLDLARGALTASLTSEPTGFPNRTDSSISFSDSSPDRTFQIEPTGASFKYYIAGVEYSKTAADTVQIADTEGLWLVYYDGTTLVATQSPPADIFSKPIVAWLYWDATNKKGVRLGDERHGLTMDGDSHYYNHEVFQARYISGLVPTDVLADGDGSLDAHAQLGSTSGVLRDEDIRFSISAILSTANKYVYYKEGVSGYWRLKTPNAFPIVEDAVARLAFNEWTGLTWQQTQVPNNDFVLCHVFADNDVSRGQVFFVQGEASYNNISAAREGAAIELNAITLAGLPTQEMVPLYTFIFQTANAYTNTPQARIRTVAAGIDYVDWTESPLVGGGGSATNHNNLVGRDEVNAHPATAVSVDSSGFNGNLTTDDDTVQEALASVDQMPSVGRMLFNREGGLIYNSPGDVLLKVSE